MAGALVAFPRWARPLAPANVKPVGVLRRCSLVVLGLSATASSAMAQAVVNPQINPGVVQSQNRQNESQIREQNDQTLVGPPVVSAPVPKALIGPPGGAKFLLKDVDFEHSAFISQTELAAIAAPYIGKKVDISDIQRIVKAVNDLYAERGIVTASAILPPQNLKDGVLHVKLVEGRLEKVKVIGNTYVRSDFVRDHIATQDGDVVDVPLLTREVAAFNKTGVAQIQASLQPGSSFGLTDIDLAVLEPPRVSVNLFADNQGVNSVNQYEGGFLIQGYSPLRIDDRLTLYGVGSQGNLDGNIAYNVPIDVTGGRAGVSYTQGQIYVVKGPYAALDIKGRSDILAGNAVQPIFVNANWFLLANGAVAQYGSSSRQMTVGITDTQTNKETVGFSAGYQDGTFAVSVSPTYSPTQTSFLLTQTHKDFALYNGTFSSSLHLPHEFLATLGGAFQVSSTPLISGDQLLQLGGPTTVRGYTTALFAAATGYYANLELHHNLNFLTNGLDVYTFYDRGSTYSTSPAVVTLNSVGAGLTYDYRERIISEVSFGIPLDHPIVGQPSLEVYFRVTAKFSSNDLASLK